MREMSSPPGRVRVCRLEEIEEGKSLSIEAFGRTVAVFRLGDRAFAVDDECPHRAGPLSLGVIEDGAVVCPLHAWAFDLVTGAKRGQEDCKVRIFQVSVEAGEVYLAG